MYKTGVTHYFSIERAKRDFGYCPESRTLDGVVRWFRERGHGHTKSKEQTKVAGRAAKTHSSRIWTLIIHVLLAVSVIALIMSFLPVVN